MDILTFTSSLVEHLAWPTATVVVVLLLRREIKQLLLLVRKLKAGPVEAEFERDVVSLAAKDPLPSSDPRTPPANSPVRLALFQVAEVSPRAAIMDAWVHVEQAAGQALDRKALYVPEKDASHPSTAIRALIKNGLIDADWISRYFELRDLRNRATHDEQFSPSRESSYAYIELSFRLISVLNAIGKNPQPD